ncbi:MAG TPA: hypothetical protein VFM28_01470 [Nitrososphaeraceae archaeon]|jgi:hypothetical protein|nr:hypothetical protein [Nitrososphaeraceae archaeon]
MSKINNNKDSSSKGKHAHSTEYRRLIWEMIVWPLIMEKNRPYFSKDEYQIKRIIFSKESNIPASKLSGGLISLVVKGILIKEENIYSLHYRLIPYLRKKAALTYGQALKETYTK